MHPLTQAGPVRRAGALRAVEARIDRYVLIDTDSAGGSNVLPRLRSLSLGNCLLLAEQMMPGEIIAHLHCTERPDVTRALVEDISRLEGVKRVTVLMLTDQG